MNSYERVIVTRGTQITKIVSGGGGDHDESPSWAPDGRRLVLVLSQGGGGGLSIAEVGSQHSARPLTPEYAAPDTFDNTPAWSPDGSTIAFTRMHNPRSGYSVELDVIRPNGNGLRRLIAVDGHNPSWSPDGKQLAFDNGRRIAVINADGTNLRYLTHPKGHDLDPAWSPDGSTIAFVRYRTPAVSEEDYPMPGETGDLWLMNPKGGNQRLLIRNGDQPAWKPQH